LNLALRTAGAAGAGAFFHRLGLVNALAQSSPNCGDFKALVCVFLFGGNDSTNTVAPIQASQLYSDYARIRGVLALPEAQLQVIRSKDGATICGLHPRLADLRQLYESGNAAVILNVGTLAAPISKQDYQRPGPAVPSNLFSHSDQQAQWQSSTPSGLTPTGWAGRLADRILSCNTPATFPPIVSLSGNNLFCEGAETRPATVTPNAAMGLQGLGQLPNARYTAFQQLLKFDNGLELVRAANRVTAAGVADAELLNSALTSQTRITTPFPNTTLGQQLRTVARILEARSSMALRRQVFFCSLGGFDTHQNQLGTHDTLMSQLNAALIAFYNATVELGVASNVTTFTSSEFNRTAQPNTNNGSDHGWGGHHLVIGGSVKGGEIYGRYPNLALGGPDDANVRGVFIPTTAVDQYNATLAAWFGIGGADMEKVFPNLGKFGSSNLGFMA
jgi:uncharacterized protein (DUF1501 family)